MRIRSCWFLLLLVLSSFSVSAKAQLTASPDPLDFGDVILTESKDDQIVLECTASSDILVSNFFVTAGNARDNEFEILSPATRTFQMAPGEKRNIIIRFAPDFEGIRTKRLFVQTSTGDHLFELKGNGVLTHPVLTLSATNLNFGKISLTGKKQIVVDITNVGEDEAKISDVNIANFSGVEHFKATPDDATKPFPVILAQGESMKLQVSFEGAAPVGFKTGSITLVGAVGGQTVIDLAGEVVEADLLIEPSPLDFGDVEIGVPVIKTVTLTLLGEEPIEIDYISDLFPPFSFVTPPPIPLTIEPGKPYELQVQVIADAPGQLTSQIQLISDDFSGSNFKGVDIFANGLTPVRVASSEDFTYYCASRKPIKRTAVLQNKAVTPISIQSFNPPMGVTVLTDVPLPIAGNASASIEYEFDPLASGIARDLIFEYLDASSVLVRDTVRVTPVTPDIGVTQSMTAEENEISVTSTFDLTDFEVRDLDIALDIERSDLFEIVSDSLKINSVLLPNATLTLVSNGGGMYVAEIRSTTPIAFNPLVPLSEQPLFTYRPRSFTTEDVSSLVTSAILNEDICANLSGDSISLLTSSFCGDDLVRASLTGRPISGIAFFPNPATGPSVSLRFHATTQNSLSYSVTDMNGSEVLHSMIETRPGINSVVLSTTDLPQGSYVLQLSVAGSAQQLKFVIQ